MRRRIFGITEPGFSRILLVCPRFTESICAITDISRTTGVIGALVGLPGNFGGKDRCVVQQSLHLVMCLCIAHRVF